MGWMQALYNTYEKAENLVGKEDDFGTTLLPIAHSTQNAQLEITIDIKGSFQGARIVGKGEEVTIIPVTEDSGSRSSGIAPHPLCDKLCYVAGDYVNFCEDKSGEYYASYMKQLEGWCEFGCHPYVKAVYLYVKKASLVKDLADSGILKLDGSGKLDASVKLGITAQPDAFVRFRIQTDPIRDIGLGEIWKEKQVYEDYIRYYLTKIEKKDLDYITGQYMPCSDKQPSKIRYSGDKAKIISANDSSGFTYRGRFAEKEEALSLGYIPSQKAHNALKWLIERQGYLRDGRVIVVWNPEQRKVPDWMADSLGLFGADDELEVDFADQYARNIIKAVRGGYCELDNKDTSIVVMAMDAATPGRLSLTYYRQISGSAFLNNLIDWHTSCIWRMSYRRGKDGKPVIMAPRVEDIVDAAFGHERNDFIKTDEKLKKATIERLLPCIIDGKRIPEDIVRAAVNNASRPLAYNMKNRKKVMDIACAMLNRKYKKSKEEDVMALDRDCDDRDYLYGRLLAVAHKMEFDTFSDEEKGKRETNADRYRSRMVRDPKRTWIQIEEKLGTYKRKLRYKTQVYYEKEFQQISDLCRPDDFKDSRKLNEQYLLGYNCELSYLYKSHKEDNVDKEEMVTEDDK